MKLVLACYSIAFSMHIQYATNTEITLQTPEKALQKRLEHFPRIYIKMLAFTVRHRESKKTKCKHKLNNPRKRKPTTLMKET